LSDKPIPTSYWVIPGAFLAGSYPISRLADEATFHQTMAVFLKAGINTFYDLTAPGELPEYLPTLQEEAARYGMVINYLRFDIQDRGLPTHAHMSVLLDSIDAALEAGRKIYLHCWGGIGRTGTTVGCWLARHGLTGEQALTRLNELYQTAEQSRLCPRSPETDAQVKFILEWADDGLA
jgi:hypothetical protein